MELILVENGKCFKMTNDSSYTEKPLMENPMTYSQVELHSFTRKLYRFLKSDHYVELKKLRGFYGYILQSDSSSSAHIVLDPRDKLISTLIHEVLHYLYPDASETKVLEMERALINQLSERQIKNIIKRFAEAL